MKKARESNVKYKDITFTIIRPTEYDAVTELGGDSKEVISKFVVDWDGIKELDLIAGGSPELVPFSTEIFIEWAKDNIEAWPILLDKISESYKSYTDKKDKDLGEQKTG